MRRLLTTIWIVVLFVVVGMASTGQVMAAACPGSSQGLGGVTLPTYVTGASHTVVIDTSTFNKTYDYYLKVRAGGVGDDEAQTGSFRIDASGTQTFGSNVVTVDEPNNTITWVISSKEALESSPLSTMIDKHYVNVYRQQGGLLQNNEYCEAGYYSTRKDVLNNSKCQMVIWQGNDALPNNACYAPGCLTINTPTNIRVDGLTVDGQPYNGMIWFTLGAQGADIVRDQDAIVTNGISMMTFSPQSSSEHSVVIKVERPTTQTNYVVPGCSAKFKISDRCDTCNHTRTLLTANALEGTPYKICDQIDSNLIDSQGRSMKNLCLQCVGSDDGDKKGIWTALGCIPREPEQIVKRLLLLGLGMGGGIALLMILVAGFQISTSQGNPEQFNKAKEMLVGAITGLLFIIFSVTILQFIGYSIFKIPGFGG